MSTELKSTTVCPVVREFLGKEWLTYGEGQRIFEESGAGGETAWLAAIQATMPDDAERFMVERRIFPGCHHRRYRCRDVLRLVVEG